MAETNSTNRSKVPDAFMDLNAKYIVDPSSKGQNLLDDVVCLMDCAEAIISHIAAELSNEDSQLAANPQVASTMLYGAMYLTQQGRNAAVAAQGRLIESVRTASMEA